ncbi:TetR/AcrR family transcriptional regulator [Flavobacterium aquatile]|uniref:TetR family transcriptional regulator n=1 Tax=Flavobacterium aquatile LMG 4008 = ATCC 11947 TaxID=1453498 RepID=A0A095STV0_9FLAO|nr:TetR/AcrR family transcriptional regulator [Flavobacterium aquatile]KGD67794.1 TetR family transcriptional regulator [Flavobacterium aquatile LMG 4008 = ATCC 11947]OXA67652.1 TetR family transcriptional regulator [Flavobacterium aquatile LMG 4008 = ATCC 11947]GEC78290.1 TetR family transcriptional regulator [Flavobacterium aquatile]
MVDNTSKRQQEIIESAGKLLMEKGIKGLTTKNLAQEMGFSESALYRHFKNKEDIIVLLLDYLGSNIKERLDVIFESSATSEIKLKQLFSSQFHFFSKNPHFVVAILSEGLFDESEKINQSIMKVIQYKMQLIAKIIEDGKKNNVFTNSLETEEILHIIIGSFRMMMLKWKFSKFEIDLINQGNKIMDITIKLLAK